MTDFLHKLKQIFYFDVQDNIQSSFSKRLRNRLLEEFRPDSIYCYTTIPSCISRSRADLMGVFEKSKSLDFCTKMLIVRKISRFLFHVPVDRWKRECCCTKVICYVVEPKTHMAHFSFWIQRRSSRYVLLVSILWYYFYYNIRVLTWMSSFFPLHRKRWSVYPGWNFACRFLFDG